MIEEEYFYMLFKELSRVKTGFENIPLQPYVEFRTTFWHWLAQQFQNKIGEERFNSSFLPC